MINSILDENQRPKQGSAAVAHVYFFVYVSIATRPFSGAELVELLKEARQNNEEARVTGMLLYKDGHFMQVLEGEEETVRALSARISVDPRHAKMITLVEGLLPARDFPDWSMGFSNLDAPEAASTPGYTEFLNTPLAADAFSENPTRAQRLLRIFKRT